MPVTGGEPRELFVLKKEDFGAIAWTPDGRQLLFVRRDFKGDKFELWRIPAEGGQPQRIGLVLHAMSQMSFHPDGQRIAFDAGQSKQEVWVMENFLQAAPVQRSSAARR